MAMYRPGSASSVQGIPPEVTRGAAFQQEQHRKYSNIIMAFLSGVTADILRMRLQQVAALDCMSVQNFLDVHKLNILMALAELQSLILIAYPPKRAAPDLSRWSTRLMCIVLRASNCLSVREQDDVVFLAKTYQQYFRRSSQKCVGLIAKRGTQAKRDWLKVCAAVQRLADKADDAELIKHVRNFICKVEMESKTTQTRKETQMSLEHLISGMIEDDHPRDRKPIRDHVSDEANGTKKKQIVDLKYTSRQKQPRLTRRPRSALPRLSSIKEQNELQRSKNSARNSRSPGRPRSARGKVSSEKTNGSPQFKVILRESKLQQTEREQKTKQSAWDSTAKPLLADAKQVTTKKVYLASKLAVLKRRYSVGDLSDISKGILARKQSFRRNKSRPVSARSRQSSVSVEAKQKSKKRQIKSRGSVRSKSPKVKKSSRSQSEKEQGAERNPSPVSWINSVPDENVNEKTKENDAETKTKYMWRLDKDQMDGCSDNHILSNRDNEQIEDRNKPLGNSSSSAKLLDAVETVLTEYKGKEHDYKDVKRISKPFDDFQKIYNYSDDEDIPNTPFASLEGNMKESSYTNDISKEYDDNMKKIANEVIVHQQMHLAVRNPLFHDKRFVDQFFKFLEANNVAKTFLRSQTTDPHKSWKLHNGKRVQFSFFLAYIFRHVENRESDQASYLVQKMLNRMQCKHKSRPNLSSTIKNGNGMDQMTNVSYSPSSVNNNNGVPSSKLNGAGIATNGVKRHPKGRRNNSLLTSGITPIARLRESLSLAQSRSKSVSRESLTRGIARRPQSASINKNVSGSLDSLIKRNSRNRTLSPKRRSKDRIGSVGSKSAVERTANRRSRSQSPKSTNGYSTNGSTASRPLVSKVRNRSTSPAKEKPPQSHSSGRSAELPSHGRRFKSSNNGKSSNGTSDKHPNTDESSNDISDNQDPAWKRSTSIANGKCWKCEHKEAAMTICVNWGNMKLCDLLLTYGVLYREEHLVAAVKANDLQALKRIVQYLKDNLYWNAGHQEVKEALFVARKHRMRKIVDFLEEEGVQDTRAIAANVCTGCLIN
ncbi:hypothetical protein DPMN_086433 [Dreissena polymorpha]|uniref:Uncharacterized protein n=2 Tax=Dreissena polymorpha TaxID=45954 RepID=A0A9D4KQF5_DREPO|nr:hypothetical protein DPMN_086433 [Dreissena polymorpha]